MAIHRLPGVETILAIASGKGGVGKTTVTVNLALALRAQGARVGIFDADIFGPNVPLMLGIHRRVAGKGYVPIARQKSAMAYIPPLERYGLKVMSMGLLVAEDQAINPLADVAGAIVVQTLRDVQWGALDYLLIDLPPSAGQPQQDLVTRVRMDGVIIVTTPQDMSLLDSARSLQMYAAAGVPVLGLIENMSYVVCPHCGEKHEVFQPSPHWRPAGLNELPVLGRIPMTREVSQAITREHPLMAEVGANQPPNGDATEQVKVFLRIAEALQKRMKAVKPA